jgi:hypothetical protein
MNKNKTLTVSEHYMLGIILNDKIESVSQLSINAWERGDKQTSDFLNEHKKELMVMRRKLGLE